MKVEPDGIYTIDDMARLLRVCTATARGYVLDGLLPGGRVHRKGRSRIYVRGSDILRLLGLAPTSGIDSPSPAPRRRRDVAAS